VRFYEEEVKVRSIEIMELEDLLRQRLEERNGERSGVVINSNGNIINTNNISMGNNQSVFPQPSSPTQFQQPITQPITPPNVQYTPSHPQSGLANFSRPSVISPPPTQITRTSIVVPVTIRPKPFVHQ